MWRYNAANQGTYGSCKTWKVLEKNLINILSPGLEIGFKSGKSCKISIFMGNIKSLMVFSCDISSPGYKQNNAKILQKSISNATAFMILSFFVFFKGLRNWDLLGLLTSLSFFWSILYFKLCKNVVSESPGILVE